LTDSRRGRRPNTRERSRFGRGARPGNRDLIRFRRNRELMAQEVTVLILWIAVGAMLLNLARTLHAVSQIHLAEHSAILRYVLPALPLLAMLGCAWRARQNIREITEIRADQTSVRDRMSAAADEEDSSMR
jgi:hypothetical protein